MSGGVLIVGHGRRGREWTGAVTTGRGCRVAGVVDPDRRARAAAGRLPTWATLDDALAGSDAAAAVLASPPALHAPQALECLRAGLGVLVEKPLALSLDDARAVADAADRTALPVVVAHNFRHRPLERAVRGALEEGAIGPLRVATIATARPAVAAADEPIEHFPLWDLGVHHLDLLRVRLGAAPDAVDARVLRSAGGATYMVRLEWEGRATADYWLREGASVYHHAEWLEGSRGALRVADGRVWLVQAGHRPRRVRAGRGPAPERVLLDGMLSGTTGDLDARAALGTIATVEAAVRSLELGRAVRLEELGAYAGATG